MRFKLLGTKTGLRVSELALGTLTYGATLGYGTPPDEARRIFNAYLEAGGNMVDTADSYQSGESERLVGEFIGAKRDEVVLATKYSLSDNPEGGVSVTGNSRKAMVRSLEQSLRRLRTDRVDIYWVHLPDRVTPLDEIVRALDDLVRSGKVLYVALSDFPAWKVARAATIAELRGLTPVSAIQVEYSLVERTSDRELIPMAEALGIGILGWSPLAGGLLTGKYRRGEAGRASTFKRLVHSESEPRHTAILDALEAVALETGASLGASAIAWVRAKGVIPVLGPRTLDQFKDNLSGAAVQLSDDQLRRLEEASALPAEFPYTVLAAASQRLEKRLAGGKLDETDRPLRPVA